ncbi:hypothetical protein [Nonomuraea sp. NPDC049709]|uniref:hypothetical protein n=1 Tax=Nonomuraea sp. NPDC049709 TaxID=3154736 RepID=UPI00341F7638
MENLAFGGVQFRLAHEHERSGQSALGYREEEPAVHVDPGAHAGVFQHGLRGGGSSEGLARHRDPGRTEQGVALPLGVWTGQLVEEMSIARLRISVRPKASVRVRLSAVGGGFAGSALTTPFKSSSDSLGVTGPQEKRRPTA